jgi:D-amino-acid dehydrogenase
LVWSAERPVSISGKVIVRETALPNVWIHAGHGHMGWTMCAGTAEAIAYDITGITEDVRECREMQKKS